MWTYRQSTGDLYDDKQRKVATGYSGGNKGQNPEGVNNPAFESKQMIGPIPEGFYTIGPPYSDSHLGPYVLSLTPDSTNVMYGRSGFKMHGDNKEMNRSASEGCVVLPRAVRVIVWESGDRRLEVTV